MLQDHKEVIAAALSVLRLDDPRRLEMLWSYCHSLATEAHIIGLLGDSNHELILQRHILENLAPAPQINRKLCLDMGTGAGLPGMVLALAMPHTHWLLLDGRKRCADFLRSQVARLQPGNVTIVENRAENYQPPEQVGLVICRALTALAPYYKLATALTEPAGRILAIKGRNIAAEKTELARLGATCREFELQVPGGSGSILMVELARPGDSGGASTDDCGSVR